MKLEDQCVSLDLAKRLKELKIKQESLFYWVIGMDDIAEISLLDGRLKAMLGDTFRSAFTVAELINMLLCHKDYITIYSHNDVPNFLASDLIGILENSAKKD